MEYWGFKKAIIGGVEHDLIIIGFDHDTPSNITQYGREKIGITMQIGIPGDASKQSIYSKGSVGSGTNNGGWEISNARNTAMSTIYNAIDNSLKPYIAEKKTIFAPYYDQQVLSSCTDKLFFASEYEVFGTVAKSPIAEGSQYEFYADSGSRVRYDAGVATTWWLRSVGNDGNTRYCAVSTAGGAVVNTFTKSQGYSLLLCI